jgi:hypothetical protein
MIEETEYRRPVGKDVWHWNPRCLEWPTRDFERMKLVRPTTGKLCAGCNGGGG